MSSTVKELEQKIDKLVKENERLNKLTNSNSPLDEITNKLKKEKEVNCFYFLIMIFFFVGS